MIIKYSPLLKAHIVLKRNIYGLSFLSVDASRTQAIAKAFQRIALSLKK